MFLTWWKTRAMVLARLVGAARANPEPPGHVLSSQTEVTLESCQSSAGGPRP